MKFFGTTRDLIPADARESENTSLFSRGDEYIRRQLPTQSFNCSQTTDLLEYW